MQTLKILGFLATIGLIAASTACNKKSPNPQEECYKGIVIGKIRSWGGGLAVSMEKNAFSNHQWRGYSNVVEALGIDMNLAPNTVIYFNARFATEEEKNYPVSADGDESAKPIIVVSNVSLISCNPSN